LLATPRVSECSLLLGGSLGELIGVLRVLRAKVHAQVRLKATAGGGVDTADVVHFVCALQVGTAERHWCAFEQLEALAGNVTHNARFFEGALF